MAKDCEPSHWARLSLTRHLPSGWYAWGMFLVKELFAYKLWGGFARAYDDLTDTQCRMERELNPYETRDMLPEWEEALGLPDACVSAQASFEARKRAMLERFEGKVWLTIEDWRELAVMAGVSATITPGDELRCDQGLPYKLPLVLGGQTKGGRYLVYIEVEECRSVGGLPYKLPVILGQAAPECRLFKCLIKAVTPSFVVVIWGAPPRC